MKNKIRASYIMEKGHFWVKINHLIVNRIVNKKGKGQPSRPRIRLLMRMTLKLDRKRGWP